MNLERFLAAFRWLALSSSDCCILASARFALVTAHASGLPLLSRHQSYFTFACAFRRSAQYRFIRAETALRACADIVRVRVAAACNERRAACRPCRKRSSGKVRSIAMISARRRLSVTSAPVRANSRKRSAVRFGVFAMSPPYE